MISPERLRLQSSIFLQVGYINSWLRDNKPSPPHPAFPPPPHYHHHHHHHIIITITIIIIIIIITITSSSHHHHHFIVVVCFSFVTPIFQAVSQELLGLHTGIVNTPLEPIWPVDAPFEF